MSVEDYGLDSIEQEPEDDAVDEYAEASEQYSAEQAAFMAEHTDDSDAAAAYAQEAHDHLENCEDAPSGLESQVEGTVYEAFYGDHDGDQDTTAEEADLDHVADAEVSDQSSVDDDLTVTDDTSFYDHQTEDYSDNDMGDTSGDVDYGSSDSGESDSSSDGY